MTKRIPDVCEYEGQTYWIWEGRSPADHPHLSPFTGDMAESEFEITPRMISTACWNGIVGYFTLAGARLRLRALLGLHWPRNEELPESALWKAQRPTLDWKGLDGAEYIEYVLHVPKDVHYKHLVLRGDAEELQFPETLLCFTQEEEDRRERAFYRWIYELFAAGRKDPAGLSYDNQSCAELATPAW